MEKPSDNHKFYVYSYTDVRPGREGEVIYIGKGTYSVRTGLRRMEFHWKAIALKNRLFFYTLQQIRALGLKPMRQVVSWHVTEEEAFASEMEGVSLHRLKSQGGTLCNLTLGGEGPSGYAHSEEANKKTASASVAMWQKDGFRERWISQAKVRMADPKFKALMSETSRALWQDPSHVAKMTSPEATAAKSEAMTRAWQDPEYQVRRSDALKAALATPEGKRRKSAASKIRWQDAEFKAKTAMAIKAAKTTDEAKAKVSEINKKIWSDPNVRIAFSARMKEVLNNPDERARKAAVTKAKWADPEFRQKMMASRALSRQRKATE